MSRAFTPFQLVRDPWAPIFETFRALGNPLGAAPSFREPAPLSVWVGDDDVVVRLELPGVAPEAIEVALENDLLAIRAERGQAAPREGEIAHRRERPWGRIERRVELPYRVDSSRVDARYEHGVLEVKLPRAVEDKPKVIEIRVAPSETSGSRPATDVSGT
jgi:HSP20 family protein